MSTWRRWAFDPLLSYVALAAVVGSILCFMLPLFAGNDEATHFVRAYQISTGRIVPVSAPAGVRVGTGACVPEWLAIDYQATLLVQQAQLSKPALGSAPRVSRSPTPAEREALRRYFTETLPRCDARSSRHYFIDTSTFAWYSPLTYLPSAAAIAVGRAVGWKSDGLDRLGRLAQLAVVILLVALAIRRAPYARWVLAIVALVPTALVVSSTIRPDAITTGLAFVVIATAMRVSDAGGFTRRTFIDALLWSILLGLSKPAYWVVAGVFLAVLVGVRWRERGVSRPLRDGAWLAAAPLVVGGAVSTIWQSAQRNRFICDVRFFGTKPDPSEAVHQLATHPYRVVTDAATVVRDHGGSWLRELVQVDQRVTGAQWPVATIAVILLAFLVLALRPEPGPDGAPGAPRRGDRLVFGLVAVVLLIALTAGFAIYCSDPGAVNASFFTARFLLPVVALALLVVAPAGRAGRLLLRQPVPPVLAVAGFYAGYLLAVSRTVG